MRKKHLSRKTIPGVCEACQKDFPITRNTYGRFCSNQCQQDFQYRGYIESWYMGEVDGLRGSQVSYHIRRHLLEKQDKACLNCHRKEWMGCPIPLELDHEDGNFFNTVPSNVRMLCATCHALTPTYKGRNRGRGKLVQAQIFMEGKEKYG